MNRPARIQFPAQPFSLARFGLVLFIILVVYASLTPFAFKWSSISALAWLSAPLPKYIPLFDVGVNVLGYFPLGFLAVFALYPRFTRWRALFVTVCFGVTLSCLLESLQTFLPERISNITDLYANSLGTLIGALFALPLRPAWLSGNLAERYRFAVFGKHQGFFLLILLFPIAQIFPQNVWLGMGDLDLPDIRISLFWSRIINNATQETLITALALISASAFLMFGTRRKVAQIKLIFLMILVSVGVKISMSQLQYGSYGIQYWASIATASGLVLGFIFSILIKNISKRAQWNIAFWGLVLLIILVNVLPINPYYLSQLEILPQGRLKHFNVLLQWLSMMWPFMAIVILIRNFYIQLEEKLR